MLRTVLIVGAAALAWTAHGSANAQSTSLFGSSGSQSSGSRSGSTASSGSAAGGSLQGGGGLGSAGGRAGGGGAFTGPQINDPGSMSSQSVGRGTGFVGQSNQGTFVGNRMAGTGGTSAMQPSFGGLGGGGGSNFNNQNGAPQGSSSTRPFRPRYRIGFEYRPVAIDVSRRAAVQASRLTVKNPAFAGLQIVVSDAGVAELRGQAPTDDARRLIENLVRLEPGVRSVTNLVEVVPTDANP